MVNEVFNRLNEQVEKLTEQANKKYSKLKSELENAYKGLEQAEMDLERYARSGDQKKYSEADVARKYHNSRIDLLTEEINRFDDGKYINPDEYQKIHRQITDDQGKILAAQNQEMIKRAQELAELVKENSKLIYEGEAVEMKLRALFSTLDAAEQFGHIFNTLASNRTAINIVDNLLYSFEVAKVMGVPACRNNMRYSKFISGTPFFDEV